MICCFIFLAKVSTTSLSSFKLSWKKESKQSDKIQVAKVKAVKADQLIGPLKARGY